MKHHLPLKWMILIPIVVIGALIVTGFVIMGLWNWLMPTIFGLTTITYGQAWGLLILSWILVGRIRIGAHRGHWRHRMAERWAKMTPEEREQLREQMPSRWHHHHDEPPAA